VEFSESVYPIPVLRANFPEENEADAFASETIGLREIASHFPWTASGQRKALIPICKSSPVGVSGGSAFRGPPRRERVVVRAVYRPPIVFLQPSGNFERKQ
jgi:hypothetical protein